MSTICYNPVKGIDDVISEMIPGTNPYIISNLRGLMEESSGEILLPEQIELLDKPEIIEKSKKDLTTSSDKKPIRVVSFEELAQKLIQFRSNLTAKQQKRLVRALTNPVTSYKQLVDQFTNTERREVVKLISDLFSSVVVDGYEEEFPQLSRSQILKGVVVNGERVGGMDVLIQEVYEALEGQYNEAKLNNKTEKEQKLRKIFDNWGALMVFAQAEISQIEDVKVGLNFSFIDVTGNPDISEDQWKFVMEEAKRESWQNRTDSISAYGSIPKEVRKVLSRIPDYNNDGTPKKDNIIGMPIMTDRMKMHQTLMDLFHGRRSQSHMMQILYNNADNIPQLNHIIEELENNPALKTQFYVAFKKAFQPYSMITQKFENGVLKFKTALLNKLQGKISFNKFLSDVRLGEVLFPNKAIYNKSGNINIINPDRVIELKKYIATQYNETSMTSPLLKQGAHPFDKLSKENKKEYIKEVFNSLNIGYEDQAIERIVNKKKDLYKIRNLIFDIGYFGLKLTKDEQTGVVPISYEMLLDRKPSGSTEKDGILKKEIQSILSVLESYQDNLRLESRVRYQDNTYNSTVTTSFMTDLMQGIESFANEGDLEGLRNFISEKYLQNSQFLDQDGKILNTWLRELYNSNLEEAASFANNFKFERSLGNERTNFENFSRQEQLIQMINEFFSVGQISNRQETVYMTKEEIENLKKADKLDRKKTYTVIHGNETYKHGAGGWQIQARSDYAKYHSFVLGDSGISKFIQARRYSAKEILDNLYDMYVSEKRRMKLSKDFKAEMDAQGFKSIAPLNEVSDKFTVLPFLNEDFMDGKYAKMIDEANIKTSVQRAIKTYLEDRTNNLQNQLRKNNLLDKNKTGDKYLYLDQEVKIVEGKDNLREILSDYMWNTYLATTQQVQMMSIDPGFVRGSKTFQKRYKQISASGEALDTEAINPYTGERYSVDGKQRVIYFDEIVANVEDFDSYFANTIAYQFGKEVLDGKIEGKTIEEIRELGKATDKYKKYKKNSTTDGQGYRTLDSYMSVLGMAGKAPKELHQAYEKIKEITSNVGRDENLTPEQISELTELQVIFQPLKPFFYGFEYVPLSNGETMIIPVQNKYAEVLLIPELLPAGSKLRDIAYYMQDNDIDVVGTTEIAKVGNFGASDIDYVTDDDHNFVDAQGNIIKGGKKNPEFRSLAVKVENNEQLSNQLDKTFIHELSYKDYRLQTNVPEHLNASNLFGTQIRKLIMKGVNFKKDYSSYVKNKKVTLGDNQKVNLNGQNLIKFYNSLIVSNILESYTNFEKISLDPDEVRNVLSQLTVNNERESKDHLLAFDKDGLPLFEPSIAHSSSSLLLSWFKKMVNKQAIKGGSAVQATTMGLKGYDEDGGLKAILDSTGKNVLEVECEIPWDANYIDLNGNVIELNYNDYCEPNGDLKLSDIEDTERKFPTFTRDGKSYIPLIETVYPNITSIVAYRIPTENNYSMLNLRVKRFSQKSTGGVLRVPPQWTTIAGFDFDIDKLFLMRYEFQQNSLTKEQVADIWKNIYKENPDLKEKLKQARDNDKFISRFFEAFFTGNLSDTLANANKKQGSITQTTATKSKLYQYWEDAGLEGTPQEVFNNYLKEHETEYLNFQEYDFNKTPYSNSRVARNNMLIQLIQERLKDEETFKDRFTPGGFSNASTAAKKMRFLLFGNDDLDNKNLKGKDYDFNDIEQNSTSYPDPEPNYDINDPMTMVEYTVQNNIAGKLIGIFANHNANYAISTLVKSFKLKNPIIFGSMMDATTEGSKGSDLLNRRTILKNGRVIDSALSLAEFLAASVDAVKDPVLNFMNLNTVTADMGAMLARLGYSMEDIGLLFNQPIIKELCEVHQRSGEFRTTNTIEKLVEKYIALVNGANTDVIPEKLTQNRLAGNIANYRLDESLMEKDKEFIKDQLRILNFFVDIQEKSDFVSDFVRNTKFTAGNAVSATFGGMYQQLYNISNYLMKVSKPEDTPAIMELSEGVLSPYNSYDVHQNPDTYVSEVIENPFGYEQVMYDANRTFIQNVVSKYFPYENKPIGRTREILKSLTLGGNLNEDTINSIHRDAIVYYLNSITMSPFNGEGLVTYPDGKDSKTTTNRDYYLNIFPERLHKRLQKDKELREMELFRRLYIEAKQNNDGSFSTTIQLQSVGDTESTDAIKESWSDLAKSNDPLYKEIAHSLYFYGFHRTGYDFSYKSINHLAPVDFLMNLEIGLDEEGNPYKYTDFLEDVNNGMELGEKFITRYLANHSDNSLFVFKPTGPYQQMFKVEMNKGGKLNDTVTIDLSKQMSPNKPNPFGKWNKQTELYEVTPIVFVDGNYYMAQTNHNYFQHNEAVVNYERYIPNNMGENNMDYSKVDFVRNRNARKEFEEAMDEVMGGFSTDELLEDYSQTTGSTMGSQQDNLTTVKDYSKLSISDIIKLIYEKFEIIMPDGDKETLREKMKDLKEDELLESLKQLDELIAEEAKNLIDPQTGQKVCE